MPRRRPTSLLIVVLIAFAACSTGTENDSVIEETPTPTRSRSHRSEPTEVSRPQPGAYVYDFVGLGTTPVPEGTQLTETVSRSGDIDVVDVTTNRNDNTRRVRLRWEPDRVVQLSNGTTIRGQQRACVYEPPLEILHIPMLSETFEDQHFSGSACEQTVQISVLDLDSVKDATGRDWPVWQIEVRGESSGHLESETRWFSPELGRDIRVETTTQTGESESQTARVLSRYPSRG